MERRKFIGGLPLVVGGALALRGNDAVAQTSTTTPINVKSYGAVGNGKTDDTAAINNAIAAAVASSRALYFPGSAAGYVISSPINVPAGFTQGIWNGDGLNSMIIASASFSGASLVTCDATLALFTMRDLYFNANGISSIATVLNFNRSPESSIGHLFENIRVINAPSNSTGMLLDGCEDSQLLKFHFSKANGATDCTAVSWHVPSGNVSIIGCVWFDPIFLAYQNAGISHSTIGSIYADGPCGALSLNAVYSYADLINNCNFGTTENTTYGFGTIHITGSWFCDGLTPAMSVCFKGFYQTIVEWHSSYYAAGASGTTLLSSVTSYKAGQTPYFQFYGSPLAGATAVGTPATGVRVTGGYTPSQIVSNGWEIKENGLHRQWGTTTVIGDANVYIPKTVKLPMMFPTSFQQSMSRAWTQGFPNGPAQMTVDVDSGNTSSLTLVLVSNVTVATAQQINWEAWGY